MPINESVYNTTNKVPSISLIDKLRSWTYGTQTIIAIKNELLNDTVLNNHDPNHAISIPPNKCALQVCLVVTV